MTSETDDTVPHEAREGLGTIGWVGINILLVAILGTMVWGMVMMFWVALVLTPVVFLVILIVTLDIRPRRRQGG